MSTSVKANHKEKNIAIVGQPNTGKSTLFNRLSGSNQHVGNWPGKTIERKSSTVEYKNVAYSLVDLPGTYSLTANSPEELIARNYVLDESPDLVVVVVDASQLSRSLYMVTEMMTLGIPFIVALNMMDVADKKGLKIDIEILEKSLGFQVIPMTASKNMGISKLMEAIEFLSENKAEVIQVKKNNENFPFYEKLQTEIADDVPKDYKVEWVAQKLMENDLHITDVMKKQMSDKQWTAVIQKLPDDDQGILLVANDRYNWISKILRQCTTQQKKETLATRGWFDRIATHPVFGGFLSLFIVLGGFIFAACLGFGVFGLLEPVASQLIQWVQTSFAESIPILAALLSQGILPAVYMICSVSAFIFGVLLFTGFLEDVGYLPRMAYVADIFMSRIGLHGKSFMPLFLGLGCNIGSVMGCRVIESTQQRFKTIIISSHMPCQGVMATIAFMIAVFFGPVSLLIIIAAAGALIIQVYITSLLLDYTVLKGSKTGMIMELPPYHQPNLQTIWNFVWIRFKAFFKRAGSLIACIIILVWALSYFPNGNMVDSYLASAGKFFEPMGMLMGMDWKLLTCLFVAFFSKEAALISMAVIYGIQIADGSLVGLLMNNISSGRHVGNHELSMMLVDTISQPSALAFIFAILFSIPCFSTIGVIFSETKSLKWTVGSTAYYTLLSFLWGVAAYHTGLLFF